MINVHTLAKTVLAMSVLAMTAAFAQSDTQGATATVDSNNTVTASGDLAFATLQPGTPLTDETTTVSYTTNDGNTYKITVEAIADSVSGWSTSPTTSKYPTLEVSNVAFNETEGSGGSALLTGTGSLIDSDNATTTLDLAGSLQNSEGSVTLDVTIAADNQVVAGEYGTTLTYSLVSAP